MSLKIQTLSGYFHEYQKSVIDPDAFWSRIANTFHWRKRWDKTVEWNFKEPSIKWFLNGKLNITENMLDRYLFTAGDRTAIIWEPNEPGEEGRKISYRELYDMVGQFGNTLKELLQSHNWQPVLFYRIRHRSLHSTPSFIRAPGFGV